MTTSGMVLAVAMVVPVPLPPPVPYHSGSGSGGVVAVVGSRMALVKVAAGSSSSPRTAKP